jgi:MYXO-CTERM domain-containing protein
MCDDPLAEEGDPELSCAYRAAAGGAPAGALAVLALAVAIGRRARRDQKV